MIFPRWSPDGRSLVYSALDPEAVRTIRADGTHDRAVARGVEADW